MPSFGSPAGLSMTWYSTQHKYAKERNEVARRGKLERENAAQKTTRFTSEPNLAKASLRDMDMPRKRKTSDNGLWACSSRENLFMNNIMEILPECFFDHAMRDADHASACHSHLPCVD